MSGILAKKIGMTQIFEDGKFIPVTVVEAGPNYVLQKKTVENDGYSALQLGFDEKKEKNTINMVMQHLKITVQVDMIFQVLIFPIYLVIYLVQVLDLISEGLVVVENRAVEIKL